MKRIPGHYLIIITLVFPSGILGADVVKRVVFRRDKTAAMYSGKLSRDGKRDLYVVGARKGQNLAVKLTIDDAEPFFCDL